MAEREELLDLKEAASFLKVSETSLRRWTNSGRLACVRVGPRRERRFRMSDLLAFLEQDSPAPEPAGEAVQGSGAMALPPGSHLFGVYEGVDAWARLAAAFLADGLDAGSACFLLGESAEREAALERLWREHPAHRGTVRRGGIVERGFADGVDRQLDWFEECFAKPLERGGSVCVVGDLKALTAEAGPEALPELEARLQRAWKGRRVAMLCLYDAGFFHGADLVEALMGHPDNSSYPVDRLYGAAS